jgi:hypothetical protein
MIHVQPRKLEIKKKDSKVRVFVDNCVRIAKIGNGLSQHRSIALS